MSLRVLPLVLALVTAPALAAPAETPGATKPIAEQNVDADGWIKVHEQGIAKVDVQNANLAVAVTNTPNVVVQSLPAVAIESMPSVTLANGTLDVQLTNAVVPVNGTVSISNFPPQQPMGPLPTVTRLFDTGVVVAAGEEITLPVATISAVSLDVNAYDNSYIAVVSGPLGDMLAFTDDQGTAGTFYRTFTYPIPVSEVTLYCSNLSDDCLFQVRLTGF